MDIHNPELEPPDLPHGRFWHAFEDDRNVIIMIALLVVVLALVVYLIVPGEGVRYHERTAMKKLREIGTAQLSYQGINNSKYYGSFKALQDNNYIAKNYTQENLIRKYSLWWIGSDNSFPGEIYGYGIGNYTFTIVAYPDNPMSRLRTFGISEDQVVRVYNPDNSTVTQNCYDGIDSPRVMTWDPVE